MKKRGLGLSIIVILLVLSNTAGIFKIQYKAEELSALYTVFSPSEIRWVTVLPVVAIVSLVAIWLGKRWGIVLAVIEFAIVLCLDLYYAVWSHAILATVAFTLLIFFCWQSRDFFRKPA